MKLNDISNSIAGSIGDKYRERVCVFLENLKFSTCSWFKNLCLTYDSVFWWRHRSVTL